MRSIKFLSCILLILVVFGGCASADKRFNQGAEMEAKGQYEAAVARYVQALEKDHTLEAARTRLFEVGNLAIDEQMTDAETMVLRGDAVSAANHYHRADYVVAQARSVGVRLAIPDGYENNRRLAFDEAFDALLDRAALAGDQGRWQDGVALTHRAQTDFEPSMDQRNMALEEESILYVQWSQYEYEQGHWRSAFDAAARVQNMEWCPREQFETAALLMEDSLDEGELELIVLPVQTKSKPKREVARNRGISDQVETELWQGPWRQPPAFILMQESTTVRHLLTDSGLLDGNMNAATMALILRLTEADYGAHLQLLSSEVNEFDIKSQTQSVKTRQGQPTTFVKESGQRRIQATARVIIADGYGNEIANEIVTGTGTAPFTRGVYNGDPGNLNLSTRQVDLFDRAALADQELAAHDKLVHELVMRISDTVFGRTLAQVQ